MKPGRFDPPVIWKGCDWLGCIIQWLDLNGQPMNISGWVPRAKTRSNIDLNAQVVDAQTGITAMTLPKTLTAPLPVGVVQWDWIWFQQSPFVITYPPHLSGFVRIAEPETPDRSDPPPPPQPPQ